MSCRFPATASAMLDIYGIGETKLERYGHTFMETIGQYLHSHPDAPERFAQHPSTSAPVPPIIHRTSAPSETVETTWQLLREGLSLTDIAVRRQLTPGTIVAHMERLLLEGKELDIDRHIPKSKRGLVEELLAQFGGGRLKDVVDAAEGRVSYDEARLVRGWMSREKQGRGRDADTARD